MYYSPEKNKIVTIKDLRSSEFNASLPPEVKSINADIAEWMGLYQVVPESSPEIDVRFQRLEADKSTYILDHENKLAKFKLKVVDMIKDQVDENGNVIKTKEQILEEQKAEQAKIDEEAAIAQEEEAKAQALIFMKNERNSKLLATDKYAIPDWPHADDTVRQAWLTYRQALRDMFNDITDPANVVWPTAPDAE
jgi:hypothetical protein